MIVSVVCLIYCAFHISLSYAFCLLNLYYLISSRNQHNMRQRYLCTQKREFGRIRQKWEISPYPPLLNRSDFWQCHAKSERFLQCGSMEKFYVYCLIKLKFCFRVHKKLRRILCKFQPERRSIKNISPKSMWLVWNAQYVCRILRYLYHSLVLLFTSYKFVKGFFAITFFYLLFLAETFMMCVNVFFI